MQLVLKTFTNTKYTTKPFGKDIHLKHLRGDRSAELKPKAPDKRQYSQPSAWSLNYTYWHLSPSDMQFGDKMTASKQSVLPAGRNNFQPPSLSIEVIYSPTSFIYQHFNPPGNGCGGRVKEDTWSQEAGFSSLPDFRRSLMPADVAGLFICFKLAHGKNRGLQK